MSGPRGPSLYIHPFFTAPLPRPSPLVPRPSSRTHQAYEDFIAVGEDLVSSGVTSPAQLGVRGGSNGGLLMGNMMTMRPDLFGAVVCAVPLLDMKRYSHLLAGASWMAEFGNPDTDDWEFMRKYSSYHNIDPR